MKCNKMPTKIEDILYVDRQICKMAKESYKYWNPPKRRASTPKPFKPSRIAVTSSAIGLSIIITSAIWIPWTWPKLLACLLGFQFFAPMIGEILHDRQRD